MVKSKPYRRPMTASAWLARRWLAKLTAALDVPTPRPARRVPRDPIPTWRSLKVSCARGSGGARREKSGKEKRRLARSVLTLVAFSERMKSVKHKILVLSGKGGVGKSTFSAQLSFALAEDESEVGLMDIDICGPSVPRMLGLMVGRVAWSRKRCFLDM